MSAIGPWEPGWLVSWSATLDTQTSLWLGWESEPEDNDPSQISTLHSSPSLTPCQIATRPKYVHSVRLGHTSRPEEYKIWTIYPWWWSSVLANLQKHFHATFLSISHISCQKSLHWLLIWWDYLIIIVKVSSELSIQVCILMCAKSWIYESDNER